MANPNIGRVADPFQPWRWAYVRRAAKGTHRLYLYCNLAGPVFLKTPEGQDWILERAEMFGADGEPDDEEPNTEEGQTEPVPEPEPVPESEPETEPVPEPEPMPGYQNASVIETEGEQPTGKTEPEPEPGDERGDVGLLIS